MSAKSAASTPAANDPSVPGRLKETRADRDSSVLNDGKRPAKYPYADVDWNFSSSIKIFYLGDGRPAPLTATGFVPMPPDFPLAGYLCQAARASLDVTQAWLWKHAKVSRKTINDFENGYASPKAALNFRIRRALERAGAQFVYGENVVGVVVYATNSAKPAR